MYLFEKLENCECGKCQILVFSLLFFRLTSTSIPRTGDFCCALHRLGYNGEDIIQLKMIRNWISVRLIKTLRMRIGKNNFLVKSSTKMKRGLLLGVSVPCDNIFWRLYITQLKPIPQCWCVLTNQSSEREKLRFCTF